MGPQAELIKLYRDEGGADRPVQGGIKGCWAPDVSQARTTMHRLWPNDRHPGGRPRIHIRCYGHHLAKGPVMASQTLRGRKVAILLAPAGTEQIEFTEPKKAVEDAGADVDVIGAQAGSARTYNHDLDPGETFTVDKTFGQASADDYDALLVPGGIVGADKLRGEAAAVRLVRGFFEAGKPAGVICHGPWTLVEANVVRGRTLMSWPTLATDIRNAGGTWVDQEVVTNPGPRDQPRTRRPGRLLRRDRRGVRRGLAPGTGSQHLTRVVRAANRASPDGWAGSEPGHMLPP